jgi:hypothetical protein
MEAMEDEQAAVIIQTEHLNVHGTPVLRVSQDRAILAALLAMILDRSITDFIHQIKRFCGMLRNAVVAPQVGQQFLLVDHCAYLRLHNLL